MSGDIDANTGSSLYSRDRMIHMSIPSRVMTARQQRVEALLDPRRDERVLLAMREHALRGIGIAGGRLRDHRMVGGDDDDDQEQADQRALRMRFKITRQLSQARNPRGQRRPPHSLAGRGGDGVGDCRRDHRHGDLPEPCRPHRGRHDMNVDRRRRFAMADQAIAIEVPFDRASAVDRDFPEERMARGRR